MTKAEILETLRNETHVLWTIGFLNEANAAFGVQIVPREYRADPGNPKGLTLSHRAEFADGISSSDLACALCDALGVKYQEMMGRGFQVRACIAALTDAGHG